MLQESSKKPQQSKKSKKQQEDGDDDVLEVKETPPSGPLRAAKDLPVQEIERMFGRSEEQRMKKEQSMLENLEAFTRLSKEGPWVSWQLGAWECRWAF